MQLASASAFLKPVNSSYPTYSNLPYSVLNLRKNGKMGNCKTQLEILNAHLLTALTVHAGLGRFGSMAL